MGPNFLSQKLVKHLKHNCWAFAESIAFWLHPSTNEIHRLGWIWLWRLISVPGDCQISKLLILSCVNIIHNRQQLSPCCHLNSTKHMWNLVSNLGSVWRIWACFFQLLAQNANCKLLVFGEGSLSFATDRLTLRYQLRSASLSGWLLNAIS